MIQLSEIFNQIGNENCLDVATSLQMNNVDLDMSIPIYEIAYLKILPGQKAGFICGSLPEFTALRHLATSCGAVAITLNLLDLDILTLLGGVCIYTPNTGANLFIKNCMPEYMEMTQEMIDQLGSLLGIAGNLVTGLYKAATLFPNGIQYAQQEILDKLFNALLELLEKDFDSKGINIHPWERLNDYYEHIKQSGELSNMGKHRVINKCPTI